MNFLPRNVRSVPLRRTIKMDFDLLFGVGDVEPASVALPALGNNLDEHAAQGRIGNMRDTFPIGLYILLHRLVFLDLMFFDIFEVYVSGFNGCFTFVSGTLSRTPRSRM